MTQTDTLTRADAHHLVSTAETDRTLALLAEHWGFAGCVQEYTTPAGRMAFLMAWRAALASRSNI